VNKKNKEKKSFKTLKTIRRSHIISTYGVGSIYQFKNKYDSQAQSESLMLLGTDEWFKNSEIPQEWKIKEPRLQSYLNKKFFVMPPDYRKKTDDIKLKKKELPYQRFPRWHRCTSCGCMKYIGELANQDSLKCEKCLKKRSILIPIRFAVVCANGHIDDFPFKEWAHQKDKNKNTEKCEIKSFGGKGGNSSILGLKFKCITCKTEPVNLASFFSNEKDESNDSLGAGFKVINYSCKGKRPWLNDTEANCKAKQKVLLRGASNMYYSVIKSSIFIPIITDQFDQEIIDKINDNEFWEGIKDLDQKTLDTVLKVSLGLKKIDKDKLKLAINKKKEGTLNQENNSAVDEENYRYQEHDFILNKKTSDESELVKHKIDINDYKELKEFFSDIILIDRLKETRAQLGFTRLNPFDEQSSKNSNKIQNLSINQKDWLPAIVVKGEGIFIEFKKKKIDEWIDNFDKDTINTINKNYNSYRINKGLSERVIDLKFLLIHTFSHLLINRLSYNCGYASASLRERIYCNSPSSKNQMNGVLIYTAAGDSEGTLGGLVREGEPQYLRKEVFESISKSASCSYDPICIETKSQGLGGTNASACHACSFISETSCEENNQLLDRKTIIGFENFKGYFQKLIE